jgi:formate hydrogenlyase transcriptional activator
VEVRLWHEFARYVSLIAAKTMIEAALKETKGRISGAQGAAVQLGIPSSTLESKINALKINKHRFKLS